MPPKKKGKAASVDPARQQEQQKLKRAENEVLGLQRQLQMLTMEHKQARQLEQSWSSKAAQLEALLAKKEQDMNDITKAMARKSTAMQDQKQAMIEELEEKLQLLLQENADLKLTIDQTKHAADQAAVDHQCEVEGLQKRLQGIHLEYKQMLHETLDKLNNQVLSPYINEAATNIEGAIKGLAQDT